MVDRSLPHSDGTYSFKSALIHALLLLATLVLPSGRLLAGQRGVTLVYSGSANGLLRSCHCPSSPWGGLAKRTWLLHQIRTIAGTNNVVALDSGDLFPVDTTIERASLMLQLMMLMGYDGVALGDQELAVGLDAWHSIHERAGLWHETSQSPLFPWLSGSYRRASGSRQGQMLAPPWAIFDRGGLRIGVVSLTGPDAWRLTTEMPAGLELIEPARTISIFLENYGAEVDLVVILSHQGIEADRKMAATLDGVDMIIGGHSQSLLVPPEVVNSVPIFQAGRNGENLGVLVIRPNTEGRERPPSIHGALDDPFVTAVLSTPRWRIAQRIIPLTTAIEDDEAAARLISAYYAKRDVHTAERWAVADPKVDPEAPHLVIEIPRTPITLRFGENKRLVLPVANPGGAPLTIESVRSRSPWLEILAAPESIEPGTAGEIQVLVSAESIDRFFRCEFSIFSSDPSRRVIQGAFPGIVEGPMNDILDVGVVWSNLHTTAATNLPLSHSKAPPALHTSSSRVPGMECYSTESDNFRGQDGSEEDRDPVCLARIDAQ